LFAAGVQYTGKHEAVFADVTDGPDDDE